MTPIPAEDMEKQSHADFLYKRCRKQTRSSYPCISTAGTLEQHTHTCSNTNSHIPLRAQSVPGLCAHPTARRHTAKALTGLGCKLQLSRWKCCSQAPHSQLLAWKCCFTACSLSAQAAAGCAGEECHCCQLLPAAAQRGQASPRGSPELQLGWGGCPS